MNQILPKLTKLTIYAISTTFSQPNLNRSLKYDTSLVFKPREALRAANQTHSWYIEKMTLKGLFGYSFEKKNAFCYEK